MIPRNLFVAFREIPPENLMFPVKMISEMKATNWPVHVMNKKLRDDFMNAYHHDGEDLSP